MVPLSVETGGRLDGAFSNFLKEVVTPGLDFGESPVPVWTKEKRALFASRISASLKRDRNQCAVREIVGSLYLVIFRL